MLSLCRKLKAWVSQVQTEDSGGQGAVGEKLLNRFNTVRQEE